MLTGMSEIINLSFSPKLAEVRISFSKFNTKEFWHNDGIYFDCFFMCFGIVSKSFVGLSRKEKERTIYRRPERGPRGFLITLYKT